MGHMRRILIHLLMLVMLTPGLLCGPFMAAGKAHAAVENQMKAAPDCCPDMAAGHGAHGKQSAGSHGTMLFKDCAKVDLYSADHIILKKPDLKISKVSYDYTGIVTAYSLELTGSIQIRGPPFDASPSYIDNHNLYLTTQRLRI